MPPITPIVWPFIALKLIPSTEGAPEPLYVSETFLNSTPGCSSLATASLTLPSAIPDVTSNTDSILPAHASALVIVMIRLASLISSTNICDI